MTLARTILWCTQGTSITSTTRCRAAGFQQGLSKEVGTLDDCLGKPGGTTGFLSEPPGPEEVLGGGCQLPQVLHGETSQVEEMSVALEILQTVEEGMANQAPCCLATGTVNEPLQGLNMEGMVLAVKADWPLTTLLQVEAQDTS